MSEKNYREQMFNGILQVLDSTGKGDKPYDDTQKTIDMLEILELTLASTISAIAPDREAIREACDEAAFHIKKIALDLFEQEQTALAAGAELPQPEPARSNYPPKIPAPTKKPDASTLRTKSEIMRTHQTVKTR